MKWHMAKHKPAAQCLSTWKHKSYSRHESLFLLESSLTQSSHRVWVHRVHSHRVNLSSRLPQALQKHKWVHVSCLLHVKTTDGRSVNYNKALTHRWNCTLAVWPPTYTDEQWAQLALLPTFYFNYIKMNTIKNNI